MHHELDGQFWGRFLLPVLAPLRVPSEVSLRASDATRRRTYLDKDALAQLRLAAHRVQQLRALVEAALVVVPRDPARGHKAARARVRAQSAREEDDQQGLDRDQQGPGQEAGKTSTGSTGGTGGTGATAALAPERDRQGLDLEAGRPPAAQPAAALTTLETSGAKTRKSLAPRGEKLEYNFDSNSFSIRSAAQTLDFPDEDALVVDPVPDLNGRPAPTVEASPQRAHALRREFSSSSLSPPREVFGLDADGLCCEGICLLPTSSHARLANDEDANSDPGADTGAVAMKFESSGSACSRIRARLKTIWVQVIFESSWLFLCILGIASAVLAWCIDEAVALLAQGRTELANTAQSSVVSYLLWTLFTTMLAVFSVFTTAKISPLAAGSGIPQMRSMLGGFSIPGYLSLATLTSKVLGLLLALGGGMVIGKEGPFVHISCIIANQMLRIPIFQEIRSSPALKKQILAAACAVGVSSTFGAPIGGVLFSIEVTSSLYQTSEYWKGFFCVVCGAFVFTELSNFGQSRNNVASLFTTDFDPLPYSFLEIPLFLILSVACGYLGGLFVIFQKNIADIRHDPRSSRAVRNPYSAAILIAVLSCTLNFPLGDFMQYSLHNAIDDLLINDSMRNARYSPHWDEPTVFINLLLFATIKFILSALTINLPIPCGVFTPLFAVGAAIGRFFGELIVALGADGVAAGGYALIGSSSFVAAATGSVSTAVIVFELTNQLSYMLPVLLAVLIGQATGRTISDSIYESLAKSKNLPSFPHVRRQKSYSLPISKVMHSDAACIPRVVTKTDVEAALLRAYNPALDPLFTIAVVDTLEAGYYIASVTWRQLHYLLHNQWTERPVTEPVDLLEVCNIDKSTISLPAITPLNDAINLFDVHKKKSFFVVRRGKVIGKLNLREIAKLCDDGRL
ncbi:Chloride channel protein [Hondaea fermentalgiana]|uniref:Chloride channel protein n=1 Tax=Hondaea fermentalgiana TaxID=2315210 RepID=A0A2R5GP31_9STRA|nr:Chloride channel protein [Hondaea fermentalgiana]|eukprot:GBG32632.1 Chloride channel protein [Hondaea fermentalgiana]